MSATRVEEELRTPQFAKLLRNLGRDALAENADWLRMNRERLMEVLKSA